MSEWFGRSCFFSLYKKSDNPEEEKTIVIEEDNEPNTDALKLQASRNSTSSLTSDTSVKDKQMSSRLLLTPQSGKPGHRRNMKSQDDMSLLPTPSKLDTPATGSRRTSVAVSHTTTHLFSQAPTHRTSTTARKNEIDLSIAALENIMDNCNSGLDIKTLPGQLNNVIFLLKKYKKDYEVPAAVREMKMKKWLRDQHVDDEEVRAFIDTSVFAPHETFVLEEQATKESALDFFEAQYDAQARAFTFNRWGSNQDLSLTSEHRKKLSSSNLQASMQTKKSVKNGKENAIQMKSSVDMKRRLREAERVLSSPDVIDSLVCVDDWDGFNIWTYNKLTSSQPLFIMMAHLFTIMGLFEKFNIKQSTFSRFFSLVERGYRKNPFHNALHATDVVQSLYCIIKTPTLSQRISPLDVLTSLVAASIHDIGHPGTTNGFQVASSSELALRYNDKSVLENFHLAEAFRLLGTDQCDIFENLNTIQRKQVRQTMIAMVLATDMQEHLPLMSQMEDLLESGKNTNVESMDQQTKLILMRSALHCADVSNPAKPLKIYKVWVDRIIKEWYAQGDTERELGLEVSPLMDRNKPGVAKSQVGFIRFFIQPLFNMWGKLVKECADYSDNVQYNLEYYEQLIEPTPANSRRNSVLSNESASKNSTGKKRT